MQFELFLFDGLFVYKPWRLYLLVSSMLSGIGWAAMMFLPESPKFLLALGDTDKSLAVLSSIYKINKPKAKEVRMR